MFNKTVLIVDDESDIRELLSYNLTKEGFNVKTFPDPIISLDYLENNTPDIILSDWLMPEMDGLEFCRKLKLNEDLRSIPVIMITCKGDETDIVTALELGVDDYLVKPFRIKELIARMKRIIRNKDTLLESITYKNAISGKKHNQKIIIDNLMIDKENYMATLEDKPLNLTVSEFNLLYLLGSKTGKVFTREQLISSLNGDDYLITNRAIDVKIAGLRKKLGNYYHMIKTVRSIGYKFSE